MTASAARQTDIEMTSPATSISPSERLIVALDVPTVDEARATVAKLGDSVSFYKIGMELQFVGGLELARELVSEGKRVFLDAKLYDIGRTVEAAVRNIAKLGVEFLTIHGNAPTIAAACAGRGDTDLKILAVTLLTSLDQSDLNDMGIDLSVENYVEQAVKKSESAGCDGFIASGKEAARVRALAGQNRIIVTPGVRSSGTAAHDQKRVTTPGDAIGAGSDYLVVGRQILGAQDPKAEAERVIQEIASAKT